LSNPKSQPCIQTPANNPQALSNPRNSPIPQTARVNLNDPSYLDNLPEATRHVILTSTTENIILTKLNPILLQIAIDNICGPVSEVEYLRSGSLRIKTHTLEQVHTLLKLKVFTPAKTTITANVAWTKQLSLGKLYAPELRDITLNMILETLKPHGVVGIRRLLNDPTRSSVPLFVLTFLGTTCPAKIKVGYCIYNIDKYYPNPTRCTNCCRYGHQTSNCNSSQICSRCAGKGHKHTSCTAPSPKCANCQGAHEVIDRECPTFLREKQVCLMVADMGISPSEARSRLTGAATETTKQAINTNTPSLVHSQQEHAYPPLPSLTQLFQNPAPSQYTSSNSPQQPQPGPTQNALQSSSYSTAVRSHNNIPPTLASQPTHLTAPIHSTHIITTTPASSKLVPTPVSPDDCSYLSPHPAAHISSTAEPKTASTDPHQHNTQSQQYPVTSPAYATLLPIILQWLPLIMKLLLATTLTDKVECFLEFGDLLGARQQVSSLLSQLELSSASRSQGLSQ
jgi:hypothetical protein